MKKVSKLNLARILCLLVIGITAFGFKASAGLDYYEIFLNNKLIMKRALNQPLPGEALVLGKLTSNDQLAIYYRHCHTDDGLGRDRSIVLKDSRGEVVKEWKFADGNNSNRNMTIAIKDLVQSVKASGENQFAIYYASKESPIQKLAMLDISDKSLAQAEKHSSEFSFVWAAGLCIAAIVSAYYRFS